ncbi:Crp/Fnr family transcriptional regulator [Sphingomonas sp. DT-207]|uniref:Crp/Fnr family transcriptional regulator n=1 Tax=Sphingomonas sp. DT-207 TaxID=3396167 RepID=UPI003F197D05
MTGIDGHPLRLLVRKLETHHALSDADRQGVLDLPHRLRTVDAQSYLLREGDLPERCAVLLSGYAFRHKLTGDGARQILALHIPGEAVDFQNMFLNEADHNVQMLTQGQVAEVPRQAFEELALARPGVGRAILITTLVEASIFREWTLNIGRRDSRSRIAHMLCEFAIRLSAQGFEPEDAYELPMTQEQLADATGLTPVHVNRVLKALEAEGLIERNRRAIRFPHWQRMRDVADFNPRYLHIREERLDGMRE